MKAKELLKKGINKVAENKELIGITILGIGMLAFSIKFDIPIMGSAVRSSRGTDDVTFSTFIPRSTDEAKILALLENAKTLSFDSQKRRAANDIMEIAEGSIDSGAHTLAVIALRDIAGTCDFDSSKRQIMAMLKDI